MEVLVLSGTQGDTDIRQTITIESGVTYNATAYVYHPAGSLVQARLVFDGDYTSNCYSDNTITGSWQMVTCSFSLADVTADVGFRFYDQSGYTDPEYIYIDNYVIEKQ